MKNKWSLILGLVLLVLGILLRTLTSLTYPAFFILGLGVFFKLLYLVTKIKEGVYKPGFELVALVVGLFLFFLGIYLDKQGVEFYSPLLMFFGIILKVSFIVLVIRKIKNVKVDYK